MRLVEGAKALTALYKDYKSMDADERDDFYQSKCEYFQKYVELSLVAASLASLTFMVSDYLLDHSCAPTLLPRLSIMVFMLFYIVVTHFFRGRKATVYMDYFLGHGMVLASIWSIYYLNDRVHASEGFIIMNLVWLTVGFVAKPREALVSHIIFILEILISHSFNHYTDLDIIMGLQIPSALVVIFSQGIMVLYYLDHYRMHQKLELAMVTDPLTQVYNRHLLEKIISQNALKDVENAGPIAVAMLDIDYFKKINDDNGHYTGDLTLLYIGQKLSKETHDDDYVIRYGGEEFVIIFKNCDVNHACARMEQFRIDIEQATDTPVPFTVSVGVSRYTGDYSRTIQNVDMALYKAKAMGRNKVVVV